MAWAGMFAVPLSDFSRGDLLYGRLRPYLNKVWVADFDGLCSGEFLVFSSRDGLNNHFLSARLNAHDFVAFANERASGERPRVSFESLSRFPLLLPPSAEQDRIVARLNAALFRIKAGEVAAQRARRRVQRYRETVLQAAVTGGLSVTLQPGDEEAGTDTGVTLLQQTTPLTSSAMGGFRTPATPGYRAGTEDAKMEAPLQTANSARKSLAAAIPRALGVC